MTFPDKLVSLLTQYDVKMEAAAAKRRAPHNIYALGIMLRRADDVIEQVASGVSIGRALYDNFNDRLLTYLEKAFAVPVTFGGGAQSKGRPE